MRRLGLGGRLISLAIATAAVYSAILMVVLSSMTHSGFAALETAFVRADLGRMENYVLERTKALRSTALDYATWDDARDFALGRAPDFVEENFQDKGLSNIGAGFGAAYRADGSLVGGRAAGGGSLPLRAWGDGSPPPGPVSSIALLGGAAFLIGAAPITDSAGAAQAAGTLVFGLPVDGSFMAAMNVDLGLDAESGSPMDSAFGFDESLLGPGDRYVRTARADLAFGYLLVRDSGGAPAFVLRSESPRPITQEARKIRTAMLLASPFLLLIVILVGVVSFRALLGSPLSRLERILESERPGSMDETVDAELAPIGRREDAIGRMARLLLEARRRTKESALAVAAVNGELEGEVEARTAELRRANHNLKLYRKIMEGTSEGVVLTGLDGSILELNDAFCRMAGYSREELLGRNPRVLKSDRHPKSFYEEMWRIILSQGRWSGEIWDRRKTGEVYPKWLAIDTILDEEGRPESYVGLSADISRLKDAEERLSFLAFYDSLTGLPNRALFRDRLAQSILRAQRSLSRSAILFIDLDRFKDVNESFGHLAGDSLLVEVSRRLQASVRESDTVCRLGGDEFAVILDEIDRSEAAGEVAAKVIRDLANPLSAVGTEVYIGASIGIALYPYDGTDVDSILKKADSAMYEAKAAGRGQFRFAAGLAGEDSKKRLEVEAVIRRALEQDLFRLHYQPQVSVGAAAKGSSAGLVGAEALIRMLRPDGSVAPPGEFIAVAEDSDLIIPIGEWALREACIEAKGWADAGRPLVVSVNVSPRQFERGDLEAGVDIALAASGLDPRLLKLEVTESLFMRHIEKSIDIMNRIKAKGVSFAVDDFGIGFSSLQYLKRLPIDYVKIDKAFVDEIQDEYEGGEICAAVISLSRAFGMASIAEGVEDDIQLAALRKRGCDEIQGYFVSRPLDADSFRAFAFGKRD